MSPRRVTSTRTHPQNFWFTPTDAYSGGYYYPSLPPQPYLPYPYPPFGYTPTHHMPLPVDPSFQNHHRGHRRSPSPPRQKLHKLLDNRYLQHFFWDIRAPIRKFQFKSSNSAGATFILTEMKEEPAFAPPRNYLRIICDDFKWPIEVKLPRGADCCLGDVLEAIHKALHEPLKEAEWNSLSAGEKRNTHISRGIRIMLQKPALTVESGIRRIDTLGEKTIFSGLREDDESDAWVLFLTRRQTSKHR